MIESSPYLMYLVACVALILVPGPSQAMVVASTISHGVAHGVRTAMGLNIGTLIHALTAGLGLSAVLATSAFAFSLVKYAGAAYLLYLGVRALSRRPTALGANASNIAAVAPSLGQATLTGVLNPKVALFFLAFLPQFVDPSSAALPQFVLLGATMAVLDTVYECSIVWVIGRVRGRILDNPRIAGLQGRVSGIVLILLGLRLARQSA